LVPYHFFGSWTTKIGSPRTKKVVRVPILSVPYQKLTVV
jgi:hypothetical protein